MSELPKNSKSSADLSSVRTSPTSPRKRSLEDCNVDDPGFLLTSNKEVTADRVFVPHRPHGQASEFQPLPSWAKPSQRPRQESRLHESLCDAVGTLCVQTPQWHRARIYLQNRNLLCGQQVLIECAFLKNQRSGHFQINWFGLLEP